ncbi:hypothetical protein C4Y55_012205 [Klebsiella pneumoniae subsp. pneumoniae]|nr:hypothetical protein CAG40_003170 [Klebsiella pneumoniae]ROG54744.1 hypothetical protein C4Y55_012205 [Klebsiella pneumoniae subsp. pneumoniae]ROG62953.1 hypothetical protein C4Y54_003270 [Klebsiella pneumoniae subsp. pneumoniae]ROG66290.1 hypothetical protein C4Y53_021355 [Klebsiella pneumoniae subsp. pneumoniae]
MLVLQRLNLHFFGIRGLVSFIELMQVKSYTLLNLLDAASAAWRRQMRLHVSVELNGAESPA